MNWMGGARNRHKLKQDQQKQHDYFAKKRLKAWHNTPPTTKTTIPNTSTTQIRKPSAKTDYFVKEIAKKLLAGSVGKRFVDEEVKDVSMEKDDGVEGDGVGDDEGDLMDDQLDGARASSSSSSSKSFGQVVDEVFSGEDVVDDDCDNDDDAQETNNNDGDNDDQLKKDTN